ncbi:YvrJ family protein [Lentibacillus sp. L22]|uniref:YvrJ family protein n=1 Tax=Lentibacillus sp. L22 TaxID=3163028 RepID=UPI003467CA88
MGDDVSTWIDLLRSVGFPIAITAYLLLRFEKKIDKLADTIAELEKGIKKNKD